jgi:hypothetical protein
VFFVIELNDGSFGAVNVYTDEIDIEDALEEVSGILESFGAADGSAEPCFVSTESERTVQLRVGPGTNRSVIAFMPANEEYQVIGRFVADDGSVWYQLNREEVLPNSAAAEVWVAQADVDEHGDCEQVSDAAAPPIIPIVNQPQPTAEPGQTDTADEGGSDTGGTAATIVPLAGYWIVNLAATSTISCLGTNTITFDSNEIFPDGLSFEVYISSVASDGSSFVMYGDTYVLQSNGFYIGPSMFNLIDLDNSQTYLMATSPTTMTGNVVANFVYQGRTCSQSTSVTLTHQ